MGRRRVEKCLASLFSLLGGRFTNRSLKQHFVKRGYVNNRSSGKLGDEKLGKEIACELSRDLSSSNSWLTIKNITLQMPIVFEMMSVFEWVAFVLYADPNSPSAQLFDHDWTILIFVLEHETRFQVIRKDCQLREKKKTCFNRSEMFSPRSPRGGQNFKRPLGDFWWFLDPGLLLIFHFGQ